MVFTLFGHWVLGGGAPNGMVRNLPMQFFTLCRSKIKVSGALFFDIVAIQNDHPSYVQHVLGSIHVFFTLFGIGCGGGGISQWTWYTTC